MSEIYTIGHSNHTQDKFISLLIEARIDVLVDVRSNPGSQWALYATRQNLQAILRAVDIDYVFMGNLLGGKPPSADCYEPITGKADYTKLRQKDYYKSGINRLLEELENHRVCIMCAEEDPNLCHRNLLVAASLREKGVQILHIRGDGRLQTDIELENQKMGVAANQFRLPF
jgi:uncharacterized protein (DUF488 family)